MGLELFSPDEDRSAVVTAIALPDGVDGAALVRTMRERSGVTVAGGQGELRGKIVRIGHIGAIGLDDVTAAPGQVLGTREGTAADVEHQLQVALAVQAAEMAGAAQRAFDITLEWAFDRYSFGRPLASYQELKHRFADMKLWLETSHALAADLARTVGQGPDAAELASAAKAYAGQFLAMLAQDCIQLHGGIGLTTEHDLHLFVRRVTVGRSTLGPPARHRRRVAEIRTRAVLGEDAA